MGASSGDGLGGVEVGEELGWGTAAEVGVGGDGFGGAALGPPAARGWAEGLGEGFAEPAFEPLADGFGLSIGVGVEEGVDVIGFLRGGAGAEGPPAAGADGGDDGFDVSALVGGQVEGLVCGWLLASGVGRGEGGAGLVVLSIDGGPGVIVEPGGVGAEGDVPGSPSWVERRSHGVRIAE